MSPNPAANDTTEPTTIPRGTTFEAATWRAHRYSDSFRVTSTVNAGKRGKACEVFSVCAPYQDTDAAMDEIAPAILWAAREGVSVETMRATLADLALAGWKFSETTARGVDVPRGGPIVVSADLVGVTFTETEMLGHFTAIIAAAPLETRIARGLQMLETGGTPEAAAAHVTRSSFRHDTQFSSRTRQDAAKAYAWAQNPANRARLVGMTLPVFRSEMSAIGVRLD